jgi:hypothetical protein
VGFGNDVMNNIVEAVVDNAADLVKLWSENGRQWKSGGTYE